MVRRRSWSVCVAAVVNLSYSSFLIALLLLLLVDENPTGGGGHLVPKAHYANRKLIAGHHATGNIVVVAPSSETHLFIYL